MLHLQNVHLEAIPVGKVSLLLEANAPELFFVPNSFKGSKGIHSVRDSPTSNTVLSTFNVCGYDLSSNNFVINTDQFET